MSRRIYDPVRQCAVAETPEEQVRQALLRKMLEELGYPKGLLAVERGLGECRRRFDIVCYACNIRPREELSPLLAVECKAQDHLELAREQLLGYNATLGAPFLCIACKKELVTFWRNQDRVESVPFLPLYRELLAKVQL